MATDVKELMAKVGKIRILTNRLIDDQLAGDYHSTFKGQGVEFDEVRPYEACPRRREGPAATGGPRMTGRAFHTGKKGYDDEARMAMVW